MGVAQFFYEVCAHLSGIGNEILVLEDVQHGQRSRASEVVAAEGGAELSVDGLKLGGDQHRAHGKAVGYALCHGDEVGTDAQPLVSEEFARASVAALYFVADEDGVMLITQSAQLLHKLLRGYADPANALNTLDDDGADIVFLYLALPGGNIIEGKVGNMTVIIDWSNDLGVVGSLYCQGRAAMKGFFGGKYARAAVIEGCELESILIGLGTRVDKKQTVVFVSANLAQSLGQLALQGVDDGVAIKAQLIQLARNGLHVMRMAMPYANDGVAAIEVEIFLPIGVPYAAVTAAIDGYVHQRIHIKEIHG